jgi:hypothetical protein
MNYATQFTTDRRPFLIQGDLPGSSEAGEEKRRTILVTLKGEPVAMVVPPPSAEKSGGWIGAYRDTGKIVGDIVAPAAEESEWEVVGR